MNSPTAEDADIAPTRDFLAWRHLQINCYGLNTGNWKMVGRPTSEEFDPARDVSQNFTTYKKIANIAKSNGLSRIFFPRPSSFNGKVCFENLHEWPQISLSGGLRISRGPLCDGVMIDPAHEPKSGFLIMSADCPTLIFYNTETGRFVATHAGRWSIIDKANAHNGKLERPFEGALEWAIHAHRKSALRHRESFYTEHLKVFVCCGIKRGFTHSPTHPQHGENNKKLWMHLERLVPDCSQETYRDGNDLLLDRFIAKRLVVLGIPDGNITLDNIDTLNDRDSNGKPIWASAVRNQNERNAVLVYRKP